MTGVTVRGFVNGQVVFTKSMDIDQDDFETRVTALDHIRLLLEYTGPDDVCYLEIHFLDDDTYCRFGTDRSAMWEPVPLKVPLKGAKGISLDVDGDRWKVE